ncbi:hypothetical protein DY000_02018266 [Brassica cretica]|uniref:BHLH domain-containing protein n=1 Tax=Brassica cretica TaxID=69181 RepID=A0ABQ7CV70_BRACR|nr:hypothetical protein DY000_02018266 [Brassica cretica]
MRNTSIERRKSQLRSVAQDSRGENPTATDKSPESHRASPRKQNAELWSRERREKARSIITLLVFSSL